MTDDRWQTAGDRRQAAGGRWQKKNLPPAVCCLSSALLLFAAFLLYDSSTPAQSEKKITSRHSGTEVIESAIQQFQGIKTIKSKVLLKYHFFGEGYWGGGDYYEKRLPAPQEPAVSSNLFSLVLKVQADSFSSSKTSSSTLRIGANGIDFWKYTEIEGERHLEHVDLVKLHDILTRSQKGNGPPHPLQSGGLGELTSLGGLEGTLIQIKKYYDFDSASVESTSLPSENRAVWKVSAKLKPDRLKTMIESYGGEKAVTTYGEEHIPAAICVYFGKEDLFPYQICYYSGTKENPFNDPPSIDLEYRNVAINGSDIATSSPFFKYDSHENVLPDEVTETYARRILEGN